MKSLNEFVSINEVSTNDNIINAMKNALKEELLAWYGYIMIRDWLVGENRENIAKFYEDTAKDELEDHAYWLMQRISQLGGYIDDITVSPSAIIDATHKYIAPVWKGDKIDIIQSLETNIKNEESAIETYKELIAMTEQVDPSSNSKLKEILADEETHLQELKDYLDDMNLK